MNQNENIEISVIIPAYNSEDTIIQCVSSVINQDYDHFIEIVIVNDGSIDKTYEKVTSLKHSVVNKNISFKIINQSNSGVASARNAGIKVASGKWIAFLDSDDIWLTKKLKNQFAEINKNQNIKFLGSNSTVSKYPFFGKSKLKLFKINARQLIFHWYPPTSTIIIRKDILFKTSLFEDGKRHGEDCDLWLRCMFYCDVYILNKDLMYFGFDKNPWGDSGLSADIIQMHRGEIDILSRAWKRNQIDISSYIFLKLWLKIKFIRRIVLHSIKTLR